MARVPTQAHRFEKTITLAANETGAPIVVPPGVKDVSIEMKPSAGTITPEVTSSPIANVAPLRVQVPNLQDVDFVDSNPDTIVRNDGGSFVDDGFLQGMIVTVRGSASNDGTYTIDTGGVAAGTLTLIGGDSLTVESGANGIELDGVIDPNTNAFWVVTTGGGVVADTREVVPGPMTAVRFVGSAGGAGDCTVIGDR